MAGAGHILYRLLFLEVDPFLKGLGLPDYVAGPASGSILLGLMIPLFWWIFNDSPKRLRDIQDPFRKQRTVPAILGGGLAGLIAATIVLGISLFIEGSDSAFPTLPEILAIVIWTPVVEELYYRFMLQGYLMRSIENQGHPPIYSQYLPLCFATVCFVFSHDYFIAPVLLIPSLAFGLVFIRWNAASAMISHGVYNAVLIGGTYVSKLHG